MVLPPIRLAPAREARLEEPKSVAQLLDAGGLADPITQVVQLGSANVPTPGDFDSLDEVPQPTMALVWATGVA